VSHHIFETIFHEQVEIITQHIYRSISDAKWSSQSQINSVKELKALIWKLLNKIDSNNSICINTNTIVAVYFTSCSAFQYHDVTVNYSGSAISRQQPFIKFINRWPWKKWTLLDEMLKVLSQNYWYWQYISTAVLVLLSAIHYCQSTVISSDSNFHEHC